MRRDERQHLFCSSRLQIRLDFSIRTHSRKLVMMGIGEQGETLAGEM